MKERGDARERAWSRFRPLWGSLGAANLGDGLMVTLGPLLAASLTRDPVLVAGVAIARTSPWLVFTLVAGVLIDRGDRRRLMLAANLIRAAALLGLAGAIALDVHTVWILYVTVFALGIAETIVDNAALAALPGLVPTGLLDRANGRLVATQSVLNQFVGPPLGSALYTLSVIAAFTTNAAVFAVAGLLLLAMPSVPVTAGTDEPAVARLREGLRSFWDYRLLRTLAFAAASVNFASSLGGAVLVLMVTGPMDGDETSFGLLLAAAALGATLGGLVAERLIGLLGRSGVVVGAAIFLVVENLVLAWVPTVWLAALAMAATAFVGTGGQVVLFSLRQKVVPAELLGRVTSVFRLPATGANVFGALIGGLVAREAGLSAPFILGAAVAAVTALWLVFNLPEGRFARLDVAPPADS